MRATPFTIVVLLAAAASLVNGSPLDPDKMARKLATCAGVATTWVQTCWFALDGMAPDASAELAYCELLRPLADKLVVFVVVWVLDVVDLFDRGKNLFASLLAKLEDALQLDGGAVRQLQLGGCVTLDGFLAQSVEGEYV